MTPTQKTFPTSCETCVQPCRNGWMSATTQIQTRRQLLRWQRLAALHEQASWALLADAAVGHVNERALTELGIAWNDAETDAMLQDDRLALLLTRSLWTLQQSAAALPQSEPLAELARHAREMSREMMAAPQSDSRNSPMTLDCGLRCWPVSSSPRSFLPSRS